MKKKEKENEDNPFDNNFLRNKISEWFVCCSLLNGNSSAKDPRG